MLPRNSLITWLFLPFLYDFGVDFHTDSRGHGQSYEAWDVIVVGAWNSPMYKIMHELIGVPPGKNRHSRKQIEELEPHIKALFD